MYSKPEYMTAAKTFRTILAEGGPLNFWRGLLPRMTRIIGAARPWVGRRFTPRARASFPPPPRRVRRSSRAAPQPTRRHVPPYQRALRGGGLPGGAAGPQAHSRGGSPAGIWALRAVPGPGGGGLPERAAGPQEDSKRRLSSRRAGPGVSAAAAAPAGRAPRPRRDRPLWRRGARHSFPGRRHIGSLRGGRAAARRDRARAAPAFPCPGLCGLIRDCVTQLRGRWPTARACSGLQLAAEGGRGAWGGLGRATGGGDWRQPWQWAVQILD